ncbi:hypothetical protein LUZ61_002837 [Rhynchospora tenuis]|uniref:CCHC-type domain-containing protein n=1 Tax=Rhynchospora tenuis TaxID=198213 RepID=A0AAD6ES40_9POAL|nr:hypothetical protein LUZ61_002837 [Rhynchospora tenuis]
MTRGRSALADEPQAPAAEQQPTPPIEPEPVAKNLETLLQGLERIARTAVEAGQRCHRDVDPFFELYCSFSSLAPPHFDGTGDFLAAENWLGSIKDKFQLVRVPEEDKVELATQFLDGYARFWWQETRRRYEGDLPRLPWGWFEKQFEERYMDIMSRESLRQQFTSLKQDSSTVSEYNTKFENLMRYAPDIVNDEFRLRQQHLYGLDPRLAQLIDIPRINRLPDLMLRATTTESYDVRINQVNCIRNVKPKIEGPKIKAQHVENIREKTDPIPRKKPWCRRCQKPHYESKCRFLSGLCFNCNEPGHLARECPKPDKRGINIQTNTNPGTTNQQRGQSSAGGGRAGVYSHTCCHARTTLAAPRDGTTKKKGAYANFMIG